MKLIKLKKWVIAQVYQMRYELWILPLILGCFLQILDIMTIGDWIGFTLIHFFGLTLIVYDIFLKDKKGVKKECVVQR